MTSRRLHVVIHNAGWCVLTVAIRRSDAAHFDGGRRAVVDVVVGARLVHGAATFARRLRTVEVATFELGDLTQQELLVAALLNKHNARKLILHVHVHQRKWTSLYAY